jgi:undecaprenyl diphosphate synthase
MKEEIDEIKMPEHIAIIMDGNRRWARERNMDKKLGHKEGAKTLEKIVRYANKIGLKYITVYAFSTENWKRSEDEVSALMLLLQNYLDDYSKRANTENIRIKVLGDITRLNSGLQKSINNAIERTKNNTGTTFCIALNYGGRDEIVNAVKNIGLNIQKGNLAPEDINEQLITENLYTNGIPDPDLLIRTSGEMRLSNFLPWQLVYSEFLFIQKNWPDFTEEDLDEAIEEYKKRNRKFGAK